MSSVITSCSRYYPLLLQDTDDVPGFLPPTVGHAVQGRDVMLCRSRRYVSPQHFRTA